MNRRAQQLWLGAALSAVCACTGPFAEDTQMLQQMPSLERASTWLNSPPLTADELRGKVVLIDFWTYTCINWWRTLPYVRAWAEKYQRQGLVVIGVHTPEFKFERDLDKVRRAVSEQDVDYPVAVDNEESTQLNKAGGRVAYRFHARDVHLVMGTATPGTPVRFRVRIDGQPPASSHGADVDEAGNGAVDGPKMYQLIRQTGPIADRLFEIEFLDAAAEIFAFTFG